MKPIGKLLAGALALAALAAVARGADYPDAKALEARVQALANAQPALARAASAAKSREGRDVWEIELGAGSDQERATRPAMLVVAGIEGNDPAGTEAALRWAERLAKDYGEKEETKKLLDTTTIYVFPRANPDAAERFFAKPLAETAVNTRPFDDDHDGLADEDPGDDLNGDGAVAWMRIEDPDGEYMIDPDEPRLMKKAEASKREKGGWRYLTEGKDDDGDERWNEDGLGGVNFNRNFPYRYGFFAVDAGPHQVSEAETRALADFIVAHPNIGIVFVFGAGESLLAAPEIEKEEGEKGGVQRTSLGRIRNRRKPATGMDEKDAPYLKELGAAWRKMIGLEKESKNSAVPGAFADWVYFHRGRIALAARAWSPAIQLGRESEAKKEAAKKDEEKKDETNAAKADKDAEKPEENKAETPAEEAEKGPAKQNGKKEEKEKGEDAKFLKWADEKAKGLFIPWAPFEHPDFPGQKCEIGGFAPYAKAAPPADVFAELASKHEDFLTTLALRLPRVAIREIKAKRLGEDAVYEARITVENTSYLPTVLAHGETTGEVLPTRLEIGLPDAAFLSGSRITRLGALAGSGGFEEVRFIIHPSPGVKEASISVISALGGRAEGTLKLE